MDGYSDDPISGGWLMPTQLSIPFSVDPGGGIAVETDLDVQIDQRVAALVHTDAGSRLMMPAVGTDLNSLMFDPLNPILITQIGQDISDTLASYEPGVVVTQATPYVDPVNPTQVDVTLQYTRREDTASDISLSTGSNTVFILPGGNVTEVVVG